MITHSKGENQKKTKLDRIGELAKSRRETVFNNIGHTIDLDLLRECYQQLDGRKAVGIDGVTKEVYGIELEDNLQDLLTRIRKGVYKPQPSRIVEIPKEDGSTRPLAISCLEDKIVQTAVSIILTLIYEPLFLPCSYGYREGMNAHEALRALMKHNDQVESGAVIEIDLKKYFNSIPHWVMMKILQEKISDKRFLKLIETLMRSPMMKNDKAILNKRGCPQGSIISPILANICLHVCIDEWFHAIKQTHMKGKAELVRFADDMVFMFQNQIDANRFFQVLPRRLEKFGLEMNLDKSSIIQAGKLAAREANRKGERIPTYNFLGFTCYWGQSRNGAWRLKYKSRSDRLATKMKSLRRYLKENLNVATHETLKRVIRIVKGWINYHAISDNQKRVKAFIHLCKRTLFWWRNRKGGQRRLSWEVFTKLLNRVGFPENFKTKSMFATH